MSGPFHTPDLSRRSFARTNRQTVEQRVEVLREFFPQGVRAVGELCCGDCSRQYSAYTEQLGVTRYRALDLEPAIVAANQERGIECVQGDVTRPEVLRPFLDFEVLFYGPPLSVECDAHRSLSFREVVPPFSDVAGLLFGELRYNGTLVCIAPNTTTVGDARWLYTQVREVRPDVGLRLIHHSFSTVTGSDEPTEPRRKYVELWLSTRLEDAWEVRESQPAQEGSAP
ncbi:hypothetical protein [Hyalangium versicolor]|uniref:hypothetical protein n=1 Tax=Hyalangium versicolor TaxID=2861190 RepID=UPI001CCD1E11|nr:hypothetical protein [Hyalangium versicolor]